MNMVSTIKSVVFSQNASAADLNAENLDELLDGQNKQQFFQAGNKNNLSRLMDFYLRW